MSAVVKTRERVEALRQNVEAERGDEENWHREEDSIMFDALWAIGNGARHPKTIAREAQKTAEIRFARWYA